MQARIKAAAFDASICLFSNSRNAMLVWKAHIPYRLAPATKLAQVLYNQRLIQRRSAPRSRSTNTTWIWCAVSSPTSR